MAHIECKTDHVDIRLSPLDEVLALHGTLHLPYSHIRSVRTDPVPGDWFRGLRIGTDVPGLKVAGTFIGARGIAFYDFSDPHRCLIFEVVHQHYKRVVVQVDRDQDPAALAVRINERGSAAATD